MISRTSLTNNMNKRFKSNTARHNRDSFFLGYLKKGLINLHGNYKAFSSGRKSAHGRLNYGETIDLG